MQQNQQEKPFESLRTSARLLVALSNLAAMPVNVLCHDTFGPRYLGLVGPISIIPMLIFAYAFPHGNPLPLLALLCLFIARCTWVRVKHIYRHNIRRRPLTMHTQWGGTPWLCRLLPSLRTETVFWIEPLIVGSIGAAVCLLNHPLGAYLIFGAAGQLATLTIGMISLRNELWDKNDQIIEQRNMAEMTRDLGRGQ